ncbi:PTS sugar transporter subunit IIA [Mycoplasmopsis hyopharyngis]|uniref:PTS sugar transporter subunit IIA n=1 Tax=Mycoplasmopsis hyopharyngis TaxID=29558 RepID=UPI003872EB0A
MNKKDKFLLVFLTIITFGFIWIYWSKLKNKTENNIKKSSKLPFKLDELVKKLGGRENIVGANCSISKVKIEIKDNEVLEVEKIKNMKGISGIVVGNFSISLITGNISEELTKQINNLVLS